MQANADPYYLLGKKNEKIWFLYRTRHFQLTWFGKPHNKCNWEVTRVLFLKRERVWFMGFAQHRRLSLGNIPGIHSFLKTKHRASVHNVAARANSFFLSRSLTRSFFLSVSPSSFPLPMASVNNVVASSRVPDHSTPSVKLCNLPISPST